MESPIADAAAADRASSLKQKKEARKSVAFRRKSGGFGLLGSPAHSSGGSPAGMLLSRNDDAAEKKKRRRSVVATVAGQHMASGSPFASPAAAANAALAQDTAGTAALSNEQLTDLYTSCIKMCTDNKINQKNSWSLNLIDYISDVLDVETGEVTNFQVASCTLDASVKIYSYRVDSIHSEAYKVLGGLSRSGKNKAPVEDEEGESEDGPVKRTKKSSNRSVNTIEANPSSLNVKKFDLEFDVDPLFRMTSAAFDEGGARGLLLNHLSVQQDCQLVFDSTEQMRADAAPHSLGPAIDINNLMSHLPCQPNELFSRTICPSLESFEFMGWKPSTASSSAETGEAKGAAADGADAGSLPAPDILDASMGDVAVGMDYGFSDDDDDANGAADDMGAFFDDNAASSGEPFVVGNVAASASNPAPLPFGRAANPTNEVVLSTEEGSDYSYFSEKYLKNWAGPSHWRITKPLTDASSKASETGAKKKTAKEKFTISFDMDQDWDKLFSTGRAATTLSKQTVEKDADCNLLPKDVHYELSDLMKLFTKPKWTCKTRSESAAVGDAEDSGDGFYNYNNDNDVNNFCADVGGDDLDESGGFDDDGDDDGFAGFQADDGHMLDTTEYAPAPAPSGGALALVEQPRMVGKISIHYEKNAKKINVKQLKSKIWEELAETRSDRELRLAASSNGVAPPPPSKAADVASAPAQPHDFSELVHDVPGKVPQAMANSLSVPIMFVCLLHLANEKNLRINNSADMDDLHISQDVF